MYAVLDGGVVTNFILTCTHIALTPDNMKEMLDLTWEYRSKWKFIGIELGIDTGTLDALDTDNKKAEQCLTELINLWLRGRSPKPTRSAIKEALQSSRVGGGSASPKRQGIISIIVTAMYCITCLLNNHVF